MNAQDAIKLSLQMPDFVCKSYLEDLSDEDLLVRPVAGANHIAWQLGHLISSEHNMVDAVNPGSMPSLPEGFAEKYTNDTAHLDDASAFHTKDVYLKAYEAQRAGTLAALDQVTDEQLEQPAPEFVRHFIPTVAALFSMQGTHWLMHAGQWAVVRRKLGRPPLF